MLELEDVTRSFGATRALAGVSFTVERGRMTGFVGANGAGKTTAMRIILGVLAPDAGQVRFDGADAGRGAAPPVRLHAGGARPLPEDAGRRADRRIWRGCTG